MRKVKELKAGGRVVCEIRKGPEIEGLPERLVKCIDDFVKDSESKKIIGVEVTEFIEGIRNFTVYVDCDGAECKIFSCGILRDGSVSDIYVYSVLLNHIEALLQLRDYFTPEDQSSS